MSRGSPTLHPSAGSVPAWRYTRLAGALVPLCAALGPAPLRVLDVGGGHGRDAVGLARLGHEVLVLDTSAAALREALASAEQAGVADRLRTVDADLEDLTTLAQLTRYRAGGSGSFDLVLCHDVLGGRGSIEQILADVATVASSVRPGGALSLLGAVAGTTAQRPGELGLDPVELAIELQQHGLLDLDVQELTGATAQEGTERYWHLTARRGAQPVT